MLRAYREDATTLDGILDTGLFNCVSSAVLYMLAVRDLGIEVEGVRTSDHAFINVVIGGRSIDVETTNPYGFDPGGKKEFKDSFGRVTGFAYVAPGGYGDRKTISGRELVGLILSNRVATLERKGSFSEAARLGADYAALCPGPDSRAFLVDRINNYITDLESRRDFAGAQSAALAAAAELPSEPKLAELARAASYNEAIAIAQSGDWAAAFEAAVGDAAAWPGDSAAAALVSASLSSLAQAYARKGDFAGARTAVEERAGRAGPAATAAALSLVGDVELVGAAERPSLRPGSRSRRQDPRGRRSRSWPLFTGDRRDLRQRGGQDRLGGDWLGRRRPRGTGHGEARPGQGPGRRQPQPPRREPAAQLRNGSP